MTSENVEDQLLYSDVDDSARKRARIKEQLDVKNVLETEHGRNLITRLLQITGVDEEGFSSDPSVAAYAAGRRSVGLWLQHELKSASLDLYLQLLRESENG